MKLLFSIYIFLLLSTWTCTPYGSKKKDDNTNKTISDSLISVIIDNTKNERIEKRIINDTLLFNRYVNDTLFEKKYAFRNGNVKTENYYGENKFGASYEVNKQNRFINFEFWQKGEKIMSCEFKESGEIINYKGTCYIYSLNNASELKVDDTLWVNIYVVPLPHSKYRTCFKNELDSNYLCKDFVIKSTKKPIVNYYVCDKVGYFKREYLTYLYDTIANKELDAFKFNIETVVSAK